MELHTTYKASRGGEAAASRNLTAGERIACWAEKTKDAIRAVRRATGGRLFVFGGFAVAVIWGAALAYYAGLERNTPSTIDEGSLECPTGCEIDRANLTSVGRTPYFNLEPGYRLRYQGKRSTLTVTVRRRTKLVDGVETRVVERREEKDGQPTEITRRYLAIDKTTNALYCFGAHVQSYEHGEVVSHHGWLSGVRGARFTLMLPGRPNVGDRFERRDTSGEANRLCEVSGLGEEVVTPAGTFHDCLRTQVTSATEDETREKVYAPGVGLVKDGPFVLTKIARTVVSRELIGTVPRPHLANCATVVLGQEWTGTRKTYSTVSHWSLAFVFVACPPTKRSHSISLTSTPIPTKRRANWTPWPTFSPASSETAAARMT